MNGVFKRSMETKQKIVVFYMDGNQQITQRFIRVLKMDDTLVLAYCYYRKSVRTFKRENILSAGLIKKVGA
ncbi:hypothetical protein ACTWPF_12355 [Oceanobacillus sp. M65]|jgi:predicted DNA-binding transcriptional regulator YafY|uniref:WYL domain-containing protein n=1 Tax=Oceanobacillus jordanicus TaxID=2867266 RepID=A0AAW5BF12_9BACI|nr:hypothetical protein [Oceanobacillus jordanicus]MCG3420934.1 hypothetical protein [Oceanobacillus jordanicus]